MMKIKFLLFLIVFLSSMNDDMGDNTESLRQENAKLLDVIREIAISIPDLIEMENGNGESLRPLALKIREILISLADCSKEDC